MLKHSLTLLTLFAVLLLAGCVSSDRLAPSPLTLDELEARMSAASDPQKCYAQSKNYVLRQQVIENRFLDEPVEFLVEVKYEQPNKFRLTTFEENQPFRVISSNGSKAWIADYKARQIEMLDGADLKQQLALSKLGNPVGSFKTIFDKVDLQRCTNKEGEFYRLACTNGSGNPIYIYVDSRDFLIKKLKSDFKIGAGTLSYESTIRSYDRREGVMIPLEYSIVQNGKQQTVRTTYYKLNQKIDPIEFLPPVF